MANKFVHKEVEHLSTDTFITKLTIDVIPGVKTKEARQALSKAERRTAARERQEKTSHAPQAGLTRSQKTARRKCERDLRYQTVQATLARGAISAEQAKKLLPRRQKSVKNATTD
jgi:hypothetical protein